MAASHGHVRGPPAQSPGTEDHGGYHYRNRAARKDRQAPHRGRAPSVPAGFPGRRGRPRLGAQQPCGSRASPGAAPLWPAKGRRDSSTMSYKHPGSRYHAALDQRRWQLTRIRAFDRDSWRCVRCGVTSKRIASRPCRTAAIPMPWATCKRSAGDVMCWRIAARVPRRCRQGGRSWRSSHLSVVRPRRALYCIEYPVSNLEASLGEGRSHLR